MVKSQLKCEIELHDRLFIAAPYLPKGWAKAVNFHLSINLIDWLPLSDQHGTGPERKGTGAGGVRCVNSEPRWGIV